MTRPGTEPWSPGSLANTVPTRQMSRLNNDEVICAVEEFLKDQDATFICYGIEIFEHPLD